jgi:hypothetical protein
MLVDDPHQPLQIRCESPEQFLSLVIGELVGIRSNPLLQRDSLRAGSLYAATPCGTPFLRAISRLHPYSFSSTWSVNGALTGTKAK